VSALDHTLKPEATAVRRVEVITGTGRRRRFSRDDKARMVEETLVPGAVVSEVARRHGITPQQLFTWRREARRAATTSADAATPRLFVPAVVESPLLERATGRDGRKRTDQADRALGVIEVEIEIEGVKIRVGHGADAKMVAALVRALKAGP
jgi:transposase